MNNWIKLEDCRPPFMEMVIFWDGEDVWPGWDEGNESVGEDLDIYCADPAFRRKDCSPTHWMLLPEFKEE